MTTQVLFFNVFSEKDPHLNAAELWDRNLGQDHQFQIVYSKLAYPLCSAYQTLKKSNYI